MLHCTTARTSVMAFRSAPSRTSSVTTAVQPLLAALCSAVDPVCAPRASTYQEVMLAVAPTRSLARASMPAYGSCHPAAPAPPRRAAPSRTSFVSLMPAP